MAFYKGLVPLRDVLAELYPTASMARVVVGEAGLPEQFIDFAGSAIEFWQNILSVAQSNSQVQAIIDMARCHYPNNKKLVEAELAHHSVSAKSADETCIDDLNRSDTLPSTNIKDSRIQGMVQQNYGPLSINFNEPPENPSSDE